jgi:hypothetical protein
MVRTYQHQVLPAVQQLPDFRSGQILAERTTGKPIGIAQYDTEAGPVAATSSPAAQQLRDVLAGFVSETPRRDVPEVLLQL